tara:strand:+ start:11894 stop:12205 length:312 start_codon:yes stop_codon:yes gene_type:complete
MKNYQLAITVLKFLYIVIVIVIPFLPKFESKDLEYLKTNLHKLLSLSTAVTLLILYNPFIYYEKDFHDEFIVFMSGVFLLISQVKDVKESGALYISLRKQRIL